MKLISALLTTICLSSIALAQDMGGGMGMGQALSFEELDANGDGSISKEEMGKVVPENVLEQRFGRLDADSDGNISKEEFDNRPRRGMGQ